MTKADICTICLTELEAGDRGTLDPCEHSFCFECIRQWLAESSTCPSCKAPARTLVRHCADAAAPAEVVHVAAVDNRQRGYLASAAEMQADADRREACTVCGAYLAAPSTRPPPRRCLSVLLRPSCVSQLQDATTRSKRRPPLRCMRLHLSRSKPHVPSWLAGGHSARAQVDEEPRQVPNRRAADQEDSEEGEEGHVDLLSWCGLHPRSPGAGCDSGVGRGCCRRQPSRIGQINVCCVVSCVPRCCAMHRSLCAGSVLSSSDLARRGWSQWHSGALSVDC